MDTEIVSTQKGTFGIVWVDNLIHRIVLGEHSDDVINQLAKYDSRFTQNVRQEFSLLSVELQNYMAGERVDFRDCKLDFGELRSSPPASTEFRCAVYNAARDIPYGTTASFEELADMAGNAKAYRAVGSAMSQNPFLIIVPCHRVLPKDGTIGMFSAAMGVTSKMQLLKMEGAKLAYLT